MVKEAANNFLNWISSTWGKVTALITMTTLIIKATLLFTEMKASDIRFQQEVRTRLDNIDNLGREIMEVQEFSKVRSKLVLKVLGAAYYVTDSIGQTVEMSTQASEITGWEVNELLGYKWHAHIPEPERGEMLKYMASTLASQTNFVYTYTMLKPDKTRVRIKTLADRVHYPNNPNRTRGYIGVILKASP